MPLTTKDPAYAPLPPQVAMATAMDNEAEVTVEVKETKQVSVSVPEHVTKKVDGKDVKEVVMATKTMSVSVIELKNLISRSKYYLSQPPKANRSNEKTPSSDWRRKRRS